ncbi:hypothetical protein [Ramlibacter sp.]|uniref:hypothetical protein n=1 Tax=Ramlibacter sp. TaxID=1917967 RepID=UPI002CE397BB|nr:hypothetical protein [Ramlibacter sp.]HWI81992.1 hypothetical protein [Ramlibacter sp.]
MPSIRTHVAFTAAAAAALRSALGAGGDRPRPMFTLDPLHSIGKLPCAGDLVADLRLAARVWRVEQRSLLVDPDANAVISLLVGEAPTARLACDPDADRVQLTEGAQAALFAEHVGRDQPSACRLLMAALAAMPDLRPGDVVRDSSCSRHMFFVEERLFLWTPANEVRVRYLLDVGMKAGEWQQLRA